MFPWDAEKDVTSSAHPAGVSSSWAGWAVTGVSSLTSKLIRTAPGAEGGAAAPENSGLTPGPASTPDATPVPGGSMFT